VHRTILVVDVERFGDRCRTNAHQLSVRAGLYRAFQQAIAVTGVSWIACDHEDRGDGVLLLVPAQVPKAPFVDVLPHALVEELSKHNSTHPAEEQIRLRMALHAGEVVYDEHGVTATSINLAFRLVDTKPVKDALSVSPGVLAVITSAWFYDEVVRHSYHTDPSTFRPVQVAEKQTTAMAWISLPDHPYPPRAIYPATRPVEAQGW
jgi:class 3 adenylate cyclase